MLWIRRPPRSTRPDTLFPYTTPFRSKSCTWRWINPSGTLTSVRYPASTGLCLAMLILFVFRSRVTRGMDSNACWNWPFKSEEHTSELQSLMRISYAVFCLKKKNITINEQNMTLYKHQHYSTQQL